MTPVRIGTRGSPLARIQAGLVAEALARAEPDSKLEQVIVRTSGDVQAEAPAAVAPGKGVFVREIQEALLAGAVDVAVHSLKDLPVEPVAGLVLAAVLPREDVRDAFCSRDGATLGELPAGARVATGSERRVAQLRRTYGKVSFVPIRGNVDTRLRKVRDGEVEGVVLARAGLIRLGLESSIAEVIPVGICLPAPGQGAIGIEARADDADTLGLLARIDHQESGRAVAAERRCLRDLGGGCRVPIAVHATIAGDEMRVRGFVGETGGTRWVEEAAGGSPAEAENLGAELARRLISRGAAEFLRL